MPQSKPPVTAEGMLKRFNTNTFFVSGIASHNTAMLRSKTRRGSTRILTVSTEFLPFAVLGRGIAAYYAFCCVCCSTYSYYFGLCFMLFFMLGIIRNSEGEEIISTCV